jgi:hypothetical protein
MLLPLVVALGTTALAPQGGDEPSPRVRLTNPAAVTRVERVRFSMPWPIGAHRELASASVGEFDASCVPLLRWADGSIAVVQIQALVELEAGADVVLDVVPLDGRFQAGASASLPPIEVELEDAFGQVFTAQFAEDIESRAPTESVRTGSFRGLLTRQAEAGVEALYAVGLAVTELDAPRRTEVHLVLDADPRGSEPVVGAARIRRLSVRCTDPERRLHARHGRLLAMPSLSGAALDLLGPSDAIYLGDRTRKAFLLDLVPVDAEAGGVSLPPLEAWPDAAWVRHTGAFGLHGGPGPVEPGEADGRPVAPWWRRLDGGPFGALMAPRELTHTDFGWPPSALHPLVARGSWARLEEARASVLQGGLRPPPLVEARAPAETEAFRSGLSPSALARPHGYLAFDYEHVTADLAFDVFWWTADPFAWEELSRMAGAIPALLAVPAFRTSRGEGACLRAGVAAARATGNEQLLAQLVQHVTEVLAPAIGGDEPRRGHALAQPPDMRALGPGHPFDVPWQMGLLVHGLHALWSATGDETSRTLALRVARRMAGPCWSAEDGLAAFVSAVDPNVRSSSLVGVAGAQGMAIGAFVLAAEMAEHVDDRSLLLERARRMAERVGEDRASQWADELWRDRRAALTGRD